MDRQICPKCWRYHPGPELICKACAALGEQFKEHLAKLYWECMGRTLSDFEAALSVGGEHGH
jgi:hypothetical protein